MDDIKINMLTIIFTVVLTVIGTLFTQKMKERSAQKLKLIKCRELINETRMENRDVFGPMGQKITLKIPEKGLNSKLIDIYSIYYAKLRIRNYGNEYKEVVRIAIGGKRGPIWHDIVEKGKDRNPNWYSLCRKLANAQKQEDEETDIIPIPYIKPYKHSKHEVILELASYEPLKEIEISGDEKDINFRFYKCFRRGKKVRCNNNKIRTIGKLT